MKFPSEKGWLTGIIFGGTILLLAGISLYEFLENNQIDSWLLQIMNLVIILFFLWIWFDTNYTISGEKIFYKSGPIRGSIAIDSIRKLEVNKTLWSGFRPALSTKGIIVKYNKWDEIYFSPKEKEKFVAALQQKNPHLEVVINEITG